MLLLGGIEGVGVFVVLGEGIGRRVGLLCGIALFVELPLELLHRGQCRGDAASRQLHLHALGHFIAALVVARVEAALAQLEQRVRRRTAVGRMLQIRAEIADAPLRRRVDADQLHLPRHPAFAAAKVEHGRHHDRGRHALDLVARDAADLLHVRLGVAHAFQAAGAKTTSEMMPWMRFCISLVKPDITLLTTIIVATPSMTLMIDARAM